MDRGRIGFGLAAACAAVVVAGVALDEPARGRPAPEAGGAAQLPAEAVARLADATVASPASVPGERRLVRLDASEATAVARRVFRERITQRTQGGQAVVRAAGGAARYLDDHTVAPRGGGKLLISDVPLRHQAADGRRVPTDLRLRRSGGRWVPQSAPVAVSIADRADGGVKVEGTRLAFASHAAVAPGARALGENSVVYPGIATDTDAVTAATVGGAELFTILRSARSPERQRLEVDVPRGGRVRAVAGGGAEVVGADGVPTLSVSPPEAEDATGAAVPVSMKPAADGRSLVLETPHRGRDVAYPLLVDPVVTPYRAANGDGWWFAGNRDGLERWSTVHSPGAGAIFSPRNTCYEPVSCYSRDGLYVYGFAGYRYAPGANAGFQTSLPRDRTAYFSRVQFLNTYFNRRGDTAPAPFLAAGILDEANGSWTGLYATQSSLTNATLDVTANQGTLANGKTAWFGMFVDAWRTLPAWEDLYTGGVVFEISDPEVPRIEAVTGDGGPSQTGWVRDRASIQATASDPGLGIHQLAMLVPGGTVAGYAHGCTGRLGDECPTSYTRTIEWDTARLPNGTNRIDLWAYDAGQRLSAGRSWDLKVDNEQPAVALSGSLYDARNGNVAGIEADELSLHVEATDGSAGALRSGVRSIEVAVDGDVAATTQTCGETVDSCALSADRTVAVEDLDTGVHDIAVTVTDRAGNVRESSFQVNQWPTSQQYGGENRRIDTPQEIADLELALAAADERGRTELMAGLAPGDRVRLATSRDRNRPEIYEINRPATWITDRSAFFDFGATDAASGVRVLETSSPNAPSWEGRGNSHMLNGCVTDDGVACVGNAHVRSVVGNLPDGQNTVQVTAIDANGNQTDRQYPVYVDATRPRLYEINRPGTWITDPNAFFDFGAEDEGSGLVSLRTQAAGQPGWWGAGRSHMLRECGDGLAGGCVSDAHVRSTVGNLSQGQNTVEVVAHDAAGNGTLGQYHVYVDLVDPSIYEINRPAYWVNDSNKFFDFGATDVGSGLVSLTTSAVGQPGWEGAGSSHMLNDCGNGLVTQCVGDAHVRSVVSNLPTGLHTIQVEARDASGRTKTGHYHLPVDKDQPTAQVTGALWSPSPTSGDITVRADDGHSGVMSIQLYEVAADGTRRGLAGTHREDAQCPGYGCEPRNLTLATRIDLGSLGPGAHDFEIDIWDRAGNVRTLVMEGFANTTTPDYAAAAADPDTKDEVVDPFGGSVEAGGTGLLSSFQIQSFPGNRTLNSSEGCVTDGWIRHTERKLFGGTFYRFRMNVNFCFSGTTVTSTNIWVDYESESSWAHTHGIVVSRADWFSWNGYARGERRVYRKGKVENCVIKYGCISTTYPWARASLYGNGKWTRTAGG